MMSLPVSVPSTMLLLGRVSVQRGLCLGGIRKVGSMHPTGMLSR